VVRVLIVGAGAIGCLLGARLSLAGHDITLVGRQVLADAVGANGLVLRDTAGFETVTQVKVWTSVTAAAGPAYDLIAITVKAYDTALVVEQIGEVGLEAPLVTFQNGVGNEELLVTRFGPGRVISAAIDTPASVPQPGLVQVHRAAYHIGAASVGGTDLAAFRSAFHSAGFEITTYHDYRGLKWTKLLMNQLANASSAILNWTPRQVMGHPGMAQLEARAWQETLSVMRCAGISAVQLGGYPFPMITPIALRLPPWLLAKALAQFVAGGRGTKMPSLQLALAGGKRSEVDWINGAVIAEGQRRGISTPANACLRAALTDIIAGKAVWAGYQDHPERLMAACVA
jgi:2-dehydropantoate 2-reductase